MLVQEKALSSIFSDSGWWLQFQQEIAQQVRPVYMASFFVGVSFGFSQIEKPINNLLGLNESEWIRLASIYVNSHSDEFARYLTTDTITAVRKAILEAYAEGGGAGTVADKLAPLFGKVRAERIASAETNKLFGLGAQEAYRAVGLQYWEWHTVNDGHVCEICGPKNGQRYPLTVNFVPGHPVNCRCFPAPVPLNE